MYPISDATLALFMRQYRQIVEISVNGLDGSRTLTEADIIQGGMTLDRYSISGDKIEIGSAIAAELTLKLDNRDGRFDNAVFEGAELFVRLGIKKWDAMRWENAQMAYIPLGYFTVDESPKKLLTMTLTALDRMVQFDKVFDKDNISFPTTVGNLLTYCCQKCSVPLHTQVNSLTGYDYEVTACPETENLTYRQIIQWIGQITATCAFIDYDGKLRMEWYSVTSQKIDKSIRYTSDLNEQDVVLTGVRIEDDEDNEYIAGTDEYAINIVGNELIQHDHLIIANLIFEKIDGFTYRPYTCTTKSLPHLYPMDCITYIDNKGISHPSIVTHWVYKLNGRTSLSGKGVTATKDSYATANPLTARETAILNKMKKANEIELTSRQQAVLALNETIANSLGLYMTGVEQTNGSTVYYFHNAATLEDSNVIYTFREGGFAWTDDWNDGNPVWQYGMTKDGNAVLNVLSTYKIQTDYLEAGCVTAEKLSVEYRDSVTNEITGAEERITQSFKLADGELESKIAKKANASDLDALTGRVTTAETSITQNAEQIALRATKTEVNNLGETVSNHSTLIQQNSDSILLKANASDLDALTGRVTTAESKIDVNSKAITAEVTRATGVESDLSARITVTAEDITAEVTRATEAEGTLSSRISTNATSIRAKVSSSGGTDSSFAWSLTTSGFVLTSKNTDVMKVTSSGCEIIGKITTDKGEIAGWEIDSTNLRHKTSGGYTGLYTSDLNGSTYYIYTRRSLVTPTVDGSSYYSTVRFYAGAPESSSGSVKMNEAKFAVLEDGSLYATAAKIDGEINATSGTFTGTITAGAGSTIGSFSVGTDGNLSLSTTNNMSNFLDITKTYSSNVYNTKVSTGTIQLSRKTSSGDTNYITIDCAGNSFPQLHFGYHGVYDGISFLQNNASYMLVSGSSSNFIIYDCGFGVYQGGYHLGITGQFRVQTTTGNAIYCRIDKGIITGVSTSKYSTTTYPDLSEG